MKELQEFVKKVWSDKFIFDRSFKRGKSGLYKCIREQIPNFTNSFRGLRIL